MHSNRYTIIYAFGFTILIAVILAVISTGLKPLQKENADHARRVAILGTVMTLDEDQQSDKEAIKESYSQYISTVSLTTAGEEDASVDAFGLEVLKERKKSDEDKRLPLYIYTNGDDTKYIISVAGSGLWGWVTAFVAFESDASTVYGISFDHESETPGLGGEIKEQWFVDQFPGKQFFDVDGQFQPIVVLKGKGHDVSGKPFEVDGISGATLTGNGINDMFRNAVSPYAPYLTTLNHK